METIKLDLVPGKKMPSLHASQFDDGRAYHIDLTENRVPYTLDGTETISVIVRKCDNTLVSMDIANTFADKSYIEFEVVEQMTACSGFNYGEIILEKNGDRLGSLNFYLQVEAAPDENGITSKDAVLNLNRQITEEVDRILPEKVAEEVPPIVEQVVPQVVGDNYPTKTEMNTALAGKVNTTDFNNAVEQINTEIEGVSALFETEISDNIFDKSNYQSLNSAYINSQNVIVVFNGYNIIAIEINGTAGQAYRFRSFGDISLSALVVGSTNNLPVIGGTVDKKGSTNISLARGAITLDNDSKYLLIAFDSNEQTDFINGLVLVKGNVYPEEYEPYINETYSVVESIERNDNKKNQWYGKTIWWCGTSIPEGRDTAIGSPDNGLTYPEIVGKILGANVVNKALGSSMARANVRTGDYVDGLSYNIVRALSQTLEEKNYMIDNWNSIKGSLHDPNTYASLDDIATLVRDSSFEKRLTPYLDGTYPMPDLFVFDHGHNDWKSYYTMPDGTTPDTELEPTVANISNNTLAEDTFMTANSNAKLISVMGEISAIPANKRADFIASVNRNCFIGSINFLCTYILSKNPRARILFIGNLDNWEKPQVQPAQEALARSWEFPIIKMWEYTGFSSHYIPNTATFWDESGTTDLRMKEIYCKDGIHPHSDTTGVSIPLYAHIIADAMKSLN